MSVEPLETKTYNLEGNSPLSLVQDISSLKSSDYYYVSMMGVEGDNAVANLDFLTKENHESETPVAAITTFIVGENQIRTYGPFLKASCPYPYLNLISSDSGADDFFNIQIIKLHPGDGAPVSLPWKIDIGG